MKSLDDRLRASDPSRDVEAPEHVLATILATPQRTEAPLRPRARRPRRLLIGAVGIVACAALVLGVTLPGGNEGGLGERGSLFVARAYAQTAPKHPEDTIVHIVERSVQDVGGIHQVDAVESWQNGVRWRMKIATTETGARNFSDSEEHLFDGKVIRSWFSKAAPQTLRRTDGREAEQIIENARKSPLDRFRAAYRGQKLTDLGVVEFQGRRAHAYRTTVRPTRSEAGIPMLLTGAVSTFYFDPQTAVPLGSTLTYAKKSKLEITNVISTWEHLPVTPENLRKVVRRD